jgi:hypothetical protein
MTAARSVSSEISHHHSGLTQLHGVLYLQCLKPLRQLLSHGPQEQRIPKPRKQMIQGLLLTLETNLLLVCSHHAKSTNQNRTLSQLALSCETLLLLSATMSCKGIHSFTVPLTIRQLHCSQPDQASSSMQRLPHRTYRDPVAKGDIDLHFSHQQPPKAP